ncbi:spore protease YyaC [Clostridium sp.]|uniref:spore protease YyaC n=1 Tax=Clostridium sp. TaxID=1506 RepID=UPI0026204A0B|nr:spore protease YyaC [Clostridium sp.]
MDNNFSINSLTPNSYLDVKNYLYANLKDIVIENRPMIFLCIGTDRCTGDCLGPLVGYYLKACIPKGNFYVYGTLESPVHSKNIETVIDKIYSNFNDPYIIAIDASLGMGTNVGKVFIEKKPLKPGLALNKTLPAIGDISITGMVNIGGSFEFLVLQNTRLYVVMNLVETIYRGIFHFILKISKDTIKSDTSIHIN